MRSFQMCSMEKLCYHVCSQDKSNLRKVKVTFVEEKQTKSKVRKTVIIYSIFIIIICIVYFLCIHPLVKMHSIPTQQHYSGAELYQQKDKYKFEYMDEFESYLDSIDYLKSGQIVDFNYWDNSQYDSLLFGIMPKVMVIDYQLNDEIYEELKNSSLQEAYEYFPFGEETGFDLYYPIDIEGREYLTFYALNDKENIFRGFIITQTEKFTSSTDITGCLLRWSALFA